MRRALFLLAALAACAGPTGYTKIDAWSPSYGYKDKVIGDGEFSVIATGNSSTSAQRTAEIALLRAAHLTREQGKSHFLIVKQKTQFLTAVNAQSVPIIVTGVPIFVPLEPRVEREPTAVLIIHFVQAYADGALDAGAVIAQLTPHFD